jgi:serine/threonine protein kinase
MTRRDPTCGDRLEAGKYRIERKLAQGGMGDVFVAEHVFLRAPVAVKVLRRELSGDPGAVARFLAEARAAACLESAHTVRVHDVGTLEDGRPFFAMELLVGATLAERLRAEGSLPSDAAVGFVLDACDALAEAHARGLVHRDIKPSNLFVVEGAGTPILKVLDFGIARAVDAPGERWTGATMVVGSPRYMAPERMRSGAEADPRSDVFSLGAVLHEALFGQPPFPGETLAEVLAAVANRSTGARPPSPHLPQGLVDVVERTLAYDPADRFPSVVALARALVAFGPFGAASRVHRMTARYALEAPAPDTRRAPFRPPGRSSDWTPPHVPSGDNGEREHRSQTTREDRYDADIASERRPREESSDERAGARAHPDTQETEPRRRAPAARALRIHVRSDAHVFASTDDLLVGVASDAADPALTAAFTRALRAHRGGSADAAAQRDEAPSCVVLVFDERCGAVRADVCDALVAVLDGCGAWRLAIVHEAGGFALATLRAVAARFPRGTRPIVCGGADEAAVLVAGEIAGRSDAAAYADRIAHAIARVRAHTR